MARTQAGGQEQREGEGAQDVGRKRPCAPPIRWCEADIQAIVNWVGIRNEKGVAVNYEAWTTGNHTEEAGRLLQETGLDGKEGVTKKKAADKLADMVKSYKNIRELPIVPDGVQMRKNINNKSYIRRQGSQSRIIF